MKALNKVILVISFLLLTVNYSLLTANAAVPHLINYQARLTDSNGVPLNGSYQLTFRIYDAETAGNLLWEETHSGVVIQKGIFSILLGSVTALNLPFDKQYFLEIKVGNEVMSPRQRITSAAYAIRSETISDETKLVPKGAIIMWSGSIADIPSGWALCDGTNSTPDLRDKFIVGARQDDNKVPKTNIGGSLTQTGGAVTHDHSGNTSSDNSGDYRAWNAGPGTSGYNGDASRGWHSHTFTTDSGPSLPPYYALACIMKL